MLSLRPVVVRGGKARMTSQGEFMTFRFTPKTLFGATALLVAGAALASAQDTSRAKPRSDRRIPISKEAPGEVVRTDTVIGRVFGIYGPRALQMLAAYRLEGDDVLKHTIDRYLEALRPNCCTVFPPLVRHDDAFSSTLWKREDRRFVTNEFMNPMIQRSQRRLVSKMIGCLERAA